MTQQEIPVVIIRRGKNKDREGRVIPGYNGRWLHVKFEDGRNPKEAYVPPEAVKG